MSVWPGLPPALFAVLAASGAWCDARHRTIPNALNLAMMVFGLAIAWLAAGSAAALSAGAHFALALVLGMGVYALKLWGGGDTKFYAATAAWFPLRNAPGLLLAVSVAGAVLVLGTLAFRGRLSEALKQEIPYGVAIAAGGLLTMLFKTLSAI